MHTQTQTQSLYIYIYILPKNVDPTCTYLKKNRYIDKVYFLIYFLHYFSTARKKSINCDDL